ncbi:acyltransferase [Ensifer sp. LC13]|uniref:acyltransferase family protein n=1 Tax=unclassified Ensifer TaxID=2633371 RepID=UPI0008130456|nr:MULTISPECIES: acyltransferase family protein [unclassified Ensifer]OCP11376.1 acyltransferase [Ensifer sp. LC13]OCP11981.1 acyltransferase [Ensifer sp. LC11]OCP33490.1 acyltransferase [Ensifer sp. LC499]
MHYRPEIDGLRALAVVPVLLFHAGFGFVAGGFAGVDVFFVISGFLITSIIHREIRDGSFSIVGFYERRARRLAPALLVVCAVCVPFALLWMLPPELNDFGKSLYAVNLFASNFLFWDQTGYFAPSTALIPLLHTWSLAVEEQFYLVFPLLLLFLRRYSSATLMKVVVGLVLLSFAATQLLAGLDPAANFYLLPSRFWELGVGALLALAGAEKLDLAKGYRELLALLGLVAIGASYVFVRETASYPGWTTVPVVLGTALVLAFARGDTAVGRLLSLRPLVAIGLISYSLYLWHQPVFAFARLRAIDEMPQEIYALLIALCFALAYLSWRYVEQPFRKRERFGRRAIFGATLAAGSVAIALGFGFDGSDGLVARNRALAQLTEPSVGLGKTCDAVADLSCATSPTPEVAVWGDSFARHLVDGVIASKPDVRLVQLAKNNCGPFMDLAPVVPRLGRDWPQDCARYNSDVRRFLLANRSIRYVILSSQLSQYLEEETVLVGGGEEVQSGTKLLSDGLRATFTWLKANGFEPVFVAPTPHDGRDTGLCVARARLLGEPDERCELPLQNVRVHDRDVLKVVDDIADEYPVVRFMDYLCDTDSCKVEDRGVALFEDFGHFSAQGSRQMGRSFDFYRSFIGAAKGEPVLQGATEPSGLDSAGL